MGFAGFAFDVGYWYVVGNKAQKAADASALAAAVHWPTNQASARTEAQAISSGNGFANVGRTQVSIGAGARPSQVAVTVARDLGDPVRLVE